MRPGEKEGEITQRCPTLYDPWTVGHQAPPSVGFPRQEYWSGLLFPSPGDLPDPGIKPGSPTLQADALTSEPPGKSKAELNSGLKTPGILHNAPWIFQDFPVKSLRTDTVPALLWAAGLGTTNLGGGSFLGHRNFSHINCLLLNWTLKQILYTISRVLTLWISLFFISVLWTPLSFVPWSTRTQYYLLNSFHPSGITTVLCSVTTSIFQKTILYILNTVPDGKVNLIPIPLSLPDAEISLYLYTLLYNIPRIFWHFNFIQHRLLLGPGLSQPTC